MKAELPANYFSMQVKLLRFLGIEVEKVDISVLYRIYSTLIISFILLYVTGEVVETFIHTDIDTIVSVGNYSVSHFLGGIKLIVLFKNRKNFGNMFLNFHSGLYKPNEERGGKFEVEVISKTLWKTKMQFFSYALTIIIVVSIGYFKSLTIRLTRESDVWSMPFIPVTYVNTTYSPRFEIGHTFQFIGVCFISAVVYATDVTIISVFAQLFCQLRILRNSLRVLRSRVDLMVESSETCVKRDNATDITFKSCLDHHLYIILTTDNVEYLCCYLSLCVFLANLLLLCILMYYTSLLKFGIEMFQYVIYCILVIIQVFMYCSWGNHITRESIAVSDDAAAIFLPEDQKKISMAIKLMIQRSHRPLRLTAGKFAYLSLETFVAIMKGAVSYFVFLRNVNEEE